MSEKKMKDVQKRLYCLQTKTIATRGNTTNVHFCYIIVHTKTTMRTECQKMWHKEGF